MSKPIPMLLRCPACGSRHIDEGIFATKPHHTHACQHCGEVWRPAIVNTVGVKFLPGFKDLNWLDKKRFTGKTSAQTVLGFLDTKSLAMRAPAICDGMGLDKTYVQAVRSALERLVRAGFVSKNEQCEYWRFRGDP